MSTTPITKAVELFLFHAGPFLDGSPNQPVVVALKRYDSRDSWGIHVVKVHPNGDFDHRVVGLFGPTGRDEIDHELTRRWTDGELLGDYNGMRKTMPKVADYVRRQVIPLEWKSFSDDELAVRMTFRKGI